MRKVLMSAAAIADYLSQVAPVPFSPEFKFGNQINEAVLRFTGTIKDGEIEITRERDEIRNAGNAGASFSRPGKLTFKLKRLLQ